MKNTLILALAFLFFPFIGNACTLYKITKQGKTIVGNNEDYLSANNQFWFESSTSDQFGVMYMGQLNNFAQGAINEKGLMFDGFYAPYLAINNTKGKAKIPIGKAIRQVMQTMQSVKEVKAYLNTIDLSSLTNSMLVFVDKTGAYLIVEGDELIVGKESEKSFSNFYYSQTKDIKSVALAYFQKGQQYIDGAQSKATLDFCGQAMDNFAQKGNLIATQYSTIYDLDALKIRVYLFNDFTQFIEIDLMQELQKGNHKTMIADLFPKESLGYQHYVKYTDAEHPTLWIEEIVAKQKYTESDLEQMDFGDDLISIGYEWLRDKKNPKAASKVFQYGITLLPKNVDLYDSLGESYFEMGDWEKAIQSYQTVLSLDPTYTNAIEMLLKIKEKKAQEHKTAFKELSSIVDQYAENTLKMGNINSLAIAIYRDGDVYQQYYGTLDKTALHKPDDSTLYEIASISKIFAGSLAAKAVLEQKITLKDDIRRYLQGDYANLQFEGTPITIQDLLTHTLGLKATSPKKLAKVFKRTKEGYYENRAFDYTMTDLLKELKTVKLDKKPGTVYDYNSVGPELVAYILEQVYHKPYKEILQEFLSEVDLQHTYLQEYDTHKQQMAISFNADGKVAPLDKNPLLGGAFGMISSLPDLTKFMQFQLESDLPFIKESTRLLFKEEEEDDDKGYLWDVGYGQMEGFYYGKTGTSNGVQCGLLICPDSKYGMILISNNNSEAALEDWGSLYNKIETELIRYPKINLVSLLAPVFTTNFDLAAAQYRELKDTSTHYLSGSFYLNNFGYDLLHTNQIEKAIAVFEFAISEDVNNANLYDSLGEAYLLNKEYNKALLNYKKALELNPKNESAKAGIEKSTTLKNNN